MNQLLKRLLKDPNVSGPEFMSLDYVPRIKLLLLAICNAFVRQNTHA